MKSSIHTLYLLPHAHTDIGYSHDPVVTLELHHRFLDRAIDLCERTREYPEGARFRWTVEVFSSLLRWWEQRDAGAHERLRECLRRGEIDVGARYLNGTELYAPEDVDWEQSELQRVAECTGYRPTTAIQNDINGFPLAFARPLAANGVTTLVMGLNTTMGHSPFPRCTAFDWDLGDDQRIRVWNGWIYNRIKTYSHLDELGKKFLETKNDFLAGLPEDYPYDFAVTSATMGDNVGPFVKLPDEVRKFNESSTGLQLKIAAFAEFSARLATEGDLAVYRGQWPDFWTFGIGAMPQLTGMVRRAQRRLRVVEQFRKHSWADESGGALTLGRARQALAYACEHTYDSHSSSGEDCGSSDALRQKAQVHYEAAQAESASMVLLRDHLAAMVPAQCEQTPAVLIANPHKQALFVDYLSGEKGLRNFATSRQPEHLFQFDREPTAEALERDASFGVRNIQAPPETVSCVPLAALEAPETAELTGDTSSVLLQAGHAVLQLGRTADSSDRTASTDSADPWLPVSWHPAPDVEVLDATGAWPPFSLIEERPLSPFQTKGMKDMDPVDTGWNPDLTFSRKQIAARPITHERRTTDSGQELRIAYEHPLLRSMRYGLDERQPDTLDVTADFRFDADPSERAYYLALPVSLPGGDDCEYWVDHCGVWFRAETDQLPGSCNSFYQAGRGVAVSRGGQTLYIASPDSTLFQFGGFTFGQLPSVLLQRSRPFVALWIYNNYWSTNFPGYSPGLFQVRLRLQWKNEPFDGDTAGRLDETFDRRYLTHPIA